MISKIFSAVSVITISVMMSLVIILTGSCISLVSVPLALLVISMIVLVPVVAVYTYRDMES